MRPALPNEREAQRLQDAANLAGLEDRRFGHRLRRHSDALGANELGLQLGFAVLQKHLDHRAEIARKLIERFALRVGAGETGHETDVKTGIGATLNDSGEGFHDLKGRGAAILSQRTRKWNQKSGSAK